MDSESLEDYQLTKIIDYNYFKIAEILSNKGNYNKDELMNKSFVHSLFTPILSYIIDYLKNNEEKPGIIGKSIVDDIKIIYIILNHNIYDLFFTKEKGKPFNGINEIDYNNLKNEKENYFIPRNKINEEKELDENTLNEIAANFIGEKKLEGNLTELFEFKKKEIISLFKLGYSIQERIMNMLISYGKGHIIELPNLIFYQTNKKNKIYSETDRIITVDNSIKINKFFIYSKAEFRKSKEMKYDNFKDGEELELKENSCVFIEVKTTMKNLLEKENDELDNVSEVSSILSQNSIKKNKIVKMFDNMKIFIKLFENLNKKFENIILIIIIDSYFPRNFFDNAKKIAKNLDSANVDIDFDLYFVHIESDIIYTYDLNKIQKISTEKDKEINNLKTKSKTLEEDATKSKEKIKTLEEDVKTLEEDATKSKEKIKKLEKDATESKEKIKKLKKDAIKSEEELKNLKQKVLELDRKDKLRKIKKKIRNDKLLFARIKGIIKEKKNVLECEIKNIINTNDSNKVLDGKTFVKIYYKKDYFELSDDVKKKHFKNLDKYFLQNKVNQNLILIVDFVFMMSLKEIMETYFKDQKLIISEEDGFFTLYFEKALAQNNIIFAMMSNIPGYGSLDLNKIPSINHFINYYYEVKEFKKQFDLNRIQNFDIYTPLTDMNIFHLDIQKTKSKKKGNSGIILVIDPIHETEDLKLDIYDHFYNYVILLYKYSFFETNKEFLEKIIEYFFPDESFEIINIKADKIPIVKESDTKELLKYNDEFFIKNKNKNVIETKFKLYQIKSDLHINTDTYSIIDKNIRCVIESISPLKKKIEIEILIEQSSNVIYKYLKNIFKKKAKFVLLNNDTFDKKIKEIKDFISTYEKNEISTDLLSYITKYNDKKFDLIILETVFDTNNLFNDNEILIKIKKQLNKQGLFIIHLISGNIYAKNSIHNKLTYVFKYVKILNQNRLYKLNNVIVCSDD